MGSACQFPWHCLHLFVPTKRNTVDGHGENNLHIQWITCGIDGIDIQDGGIHSPIITTNIVVKKEVITRNLQRDENRGIVRGKNAVKQDEMCMSAIPAVVNKESSMVAPVV